ncbi:hypothetical protein DL96DRAFT_1625507 [Flagelloscypha sp. PMI_526]|nr:hypothetical protein DL96DRAFT_1625507 [Flagelloscypha sp. PMI_526]
MGRNDEDSILDEGHLDEIASRSSQLRWKRFLCRDSVFCSIILLQTLLVAGLALRGPTTCIKSCRATPFSNNPLVYTPIQNEIQYRVQAFAGASTISGYEGFTNESDAAWRDLYEGTIIKMTAEEASRLPNRTYSIQVGDTYIGQFDVYRQLQCLNFFRHSLEPQRYLHNYSSGFNKQHLLQCVKSLRESLMCSSDLASMPFLWDELKQQVTGRSTAAHSCRNFNKIREWTRGRALDSNTLRQISGSSNPLLRV